MKRFVYEIRDPETNVCVYVGLTVNPGQRFQEHMAPSRVKRFKDPGLQNWIQDLRAKGKKPNFIIVKKIKSNVSKLSAQKIERKHTEMLRRSYNIFNKFNGANHTNETKQWVIRGNEKRPCTETTRDKISQKNSKYFFIYKGKKYIGLQKISKACGINMTTIHYSIMRNKIIKGIRYVRYRV